MGDVGEKFIKLILIRIMSKKFKKPDMLILPDSNEKIEKFINYIMLDGKKLVARKIFNMAMKEIEKNGHPNPIVVWEKALENAAPSVMVKSKRIGWAVYQIPLEVPSNKKLFHASKWILNAARSKKWTPMYIKLADELLAAYSWQGAAVKKKEETHKMAEANKAFAYMARYVK